MPDPAGARTITTTDGVRLAVWDEGSGSPVVFVHEFGGDASSWDGQVRWLSGTHRCITFNARGYPPSDVPDDLDGYSQEHARDDVLAVLDGLGIERAALVGLSMGAFAVLHVALAAPERVTALVVAGIGYGAELDRQAAFRARMRANADAIERDGMAAFADAYGHDPARIQMESKDPAAFETQRLRLAAHSARGSANTMRGVQGRRPSVLELTSQLETLHVPTMIIEGDLDTEASAGTAHLKATIPRAELATIADAGHLLNLEHPVGFVNFVRNFIDRSDRSNRSLGRAARLPSAGEH